MTPNVNNINMFGSGQTDSEEFKKNRAALSSMIGLNMNKQSKSLRDGPQIAKNVNKNLA